MFLRLIKYKKGEGYYLNTKAVYKCPKCEQLKIEIEKWIPKGSVQKDDTTTTIADQIQMSLQQKKGIRPVPVPDKDNSEVQE